MKRPQHIKNQKGQVAVEYILITVVLAAIALSAKTFLAADNFVGNFVQKPWALVAGMIETGVWGEPKKVRVLHPGILARHNSFKGESE